MTILDVYNFINDAKTYYLATVDNGKPKVRPFGTIMLSNNKLYIQTGKKKDVSKQIHINNNVEISAFKDGKWIRLSGELVEDESRNKKIEILDLYPELRTMYNEDDGNTEVFYFKNATATIYSFIAPPETLKF